MMHKSPILRFLLAILIAWSPSACLCGPKVAEVALSCRAQVSEATSTGCCGSGEAAETKRASGCGAGSDSDDVPNGGCERCEGDCKCKTAPTTMKAEAPTTAHVAAPVVSAMVFGFEPPVADLATLIRIVRIESKAVARPMMTLLRLHCALTV